MGQDGQGLSCPMFFLQAGEALLTCRIIPEEEDGRFRDGPREMRIADFGP